ncbi:MAG: efflux RND transporter periplasmic adaptor subunit [Anaeromyxobacteraceae bacterium]
MVYECGSMRAALLRDRPWQLAFALVALAIVWSASRGLLGPQVTSVRARRQDLVARVVMTGHVAASASGPPRLRAACDERHLPWLAVGQPASAVARAWPRQPFAAEVAAVAAVVDPGHGTVDLELVLPAAPAFLRPGMAVAVNVDVARRAGALVVPAAAVHEGEDDSWVLAVRDGRTERRRVAIELHGEGMAEVKGGLAEGDEVVLSSAGAVAGERVRTREAPASGAQAEERRRSDDPPRWPRVLPAPDGVALAILVDRPRGRDHPAAERTPRCEGEAPAPAVSRLPTSSQLLTGALLVALGATAARVLRRRPGGAA